MTQIRQIRTYVPAMTIAGDLTQIFGIVSQSQSSAVSSEKSEIDWNVSEKIWVI